MDIKLRRETPEDYQAVESLTREAFWNLHSPGCCEHYLIHVLRESPDFIRELDFVAESRGRVVGHIAYTKSAVMGGGLIRKTVTFGPLSVLPQCQRQGVGRALIEHTRALAARMGFGAILILGDPAYYSRVGFVPAENYGIRYGEKFAAALQACELRPGALADCPGVFHESPVFDVNDGEVERFDKAFPKRDKLVTPTQARFQAVLKMVR